MKKTLLTILGLIIIILVLKLVFTDKVAEAPVVTQVAGPVCYLQLIQTQAGSDNTYVEVQYGENGTVSGKFNILPSEKDKMTGPFTGTYEEGTSSRRLIVDHAYSAEGTNQVEKRVFLADDNTIQISWDGGETFTQTLPSVDCSTVPASVVNPQ